MDDPNTPSSPLKGALKKFLFGLSPGDAALSLLLWIYLSGAFSFVGMQLFDARGWNVPLVVGGAAFLALFIVIFEDRTIVIPSYWARGRAWLRMGGLQLDEPKGETTKKWGAIGIRLVMAGCVTMAIVTGVAPSIFRQDEISYSRAHIQQQNAGLNRKVESDYDSRIDMKKAALVEASKRFQALAAEVATLRRKTANRLRPDLQNRLADAQAEYAAKDAEVTQLRNEIDALMAGRADSINKDTHRSVDYVESPEGFLSRIKALQALAAEDPTARAVILSLDLFLLCIELSMLMIKVAEVTPSAFAGEIAFDLYMKAVRMAKQAAAEINPPEPDPEPPLMARDRTPPANDNNPPASAPYFGTLTAGNRAIGGDDQPPTPPRRPRGRPRKDSYN